MPITPRGSAMAALVQSGLWPASPVTWSGSGPHAGSTGETGDRSGGHDTILATVERARRTGGPVAVAEALNLAHRRLMRPGLGELRHRVAQGLIAEGSRTRRRSDTATGLLWRSVDFVLDGDARAARCLTELRAVLAVEDEPTVSYVLRAIEVMFEIRAGRFEQAELHAKRCAEVGAALGDTHAAAWCASHLIVIRWYQGRITEMLPTIREVATTRPDQSPVDYSYRSALAVAAAAAGQREEASSLLASFHDGGLSDLPHSASWLVALYGVAEAAYLLGAADAADEAYELLRPYAWLPIMAGPGIACFGSVEHALGLARLTTGQFDAAADHLRNAVRDNLALGHWPAATLARDRLAYALARTSGPTDRAAARHEAETARRDARELGMRLPARLASTPAQGVATTPATSATPDCRRQDRHWVIDSAGRVVTVEHCRGMTYLAVLLANPGREINALELATNPGHAGAAPSAAPADPAAAPAPTDDHRAQRYRDRLMALLKTIERCDLVGDRDGAIRAHAEYDRLLAHLRSVVGLAARADPSPTAEERARIAVGKAIRRALARIAEADPELGEILASGIRTGQRCIYIHTPRRTPADGAYGLVPSDSAEGV